MKDPRYGLLLMYTLSGLLVIVGAIIFHWCFLFLLAAYIIAVIVLIRDIKKNPELEDDDTFNDYYGEEP